MPLLRPLTFGLATLVAAGSVLVAPVATATAATVTDELAVSVVGDGTSTGNAAVPVAIQLLDGQGEVGDTIALPTADAGTQHAFTLGADRDQQGALQQSADHRFVTLGGYDAAPGSGALNDTAAPATPRVIARIDAEGDVDTSTTLGGGFSVRHIRGTATIDGTRYWAGGHGGDSTAPAGGVLTVAGGGSSPSAVVAGSNNLNNARVVDIHDGQLYMTSDRSGYTGLNRVGTGTPTSSAAPTLVAAAPANATVAHDFAFAGDYLYVGYTEGSAEGIAKYRDNGAGGWTWVATYAGDFWGLEARQAGDDTVLYAVRGVNQGNDLVRIVDSGDDAAFTAQVDVLATAAPNTAFRGVAFAPGFEAGTDAVGPILAKPTLTWDVRIAGGAGGALAAVVGQATNPVATGVITDPAGETVTATVTSSDQTVVADSGIRLDVAADGAFTLAATPLSAGNTVLTVRLRTADDRTAIAQLPYRAASAFVDDSAIAHFGMSDASAAVDAGDGFFFAADDDSNAIRLFSEEGGEAVASFDFSDRIEFERAGEAHDFEAVAQVGDQVFWIGSTGNTRSGNVRLDRNIVLQTTISGSGADATLTFVGYRNVLRDALVAWDHQDLHGLGADRFGFAAATQPGVSAEGPNSLNIEGAAIAPDGTTLWLGFRSPEVGDDAEALIVPVADIVDVIAGADPVVGEPILLDLGGRAIRDMARTETGDYLIIAGSADDTGRFALYGWTGDLDDAPVFGGSLELQDWPGSYEGIAGVRSLADGTSVRLLLDSGTVDIYGDGTEAQDLSPVEFKMFASQSVTLDFGAVFDAKAITLDSTELTIGSPVDVEVSGFAEGESIELVLHSDPVTLATLIAGADGTARATVTVPASVDTGAHTLTATAASGVATLDVTVLAASVDGGEGENPGEGSAGSGADADADGGTGAGTDADGDLATTGSDFPAVPVALVAALLLMAGLVIARRKAEAGARAGD